MPQELTTRRSGHHPSSVASEKPHMQFALEQSDLPAEGRLCDVKHGGRLAEAARAAHADKV